MAALCGYVGVTEGHPWFGRHKYEIDAEVHGGVTFALASERHREQSSSTCHQPDEGEPDKVWWVGFDCAHSLDLLPSQPNRPRPGVDSTCPVGSSRFTAISVTSSTTLGTLPWKRQARKRGPFLNKTGGYQSRCWPIICPKDSCRLVD
jgi:hypothetical protein